MYSVRKTSDDLPGPPPSTLRGSGIVTPAKTPNVYVSAASGRTRATSGFGSGQATPRKAAAGTPPVSSRTPEDSGMERALSDAPKPPGEGVVERGRC